MKKDDLVFVEHMLDCARDISARLGTVDKCGFDGDDNLRLAVTHLIQTIGEAARRVSGDFRISHDEVPWSTIVGMRHRIVHDYIHVDFETVWEVASRDVPIPLAQLQSIVNCE